MKQELLNSLLDSQQEQDTQRLPQVSGNSPSSCSVSKASKISTGHTYVGTQTHWYRSINIKCRRRMANLAPILHFFSFHLLFFQPKKKEKETLLHEDDDKAITIYQHIDNMLFEWKGVYGK